MKTKPRIAILILMTLLLSLSLAGCNLYEDAPPVAEEDEIKVLINLDLNEDIGLLLTKYTVNGKEGMSGNSNADKSMLQRDSTNLVWSYNKEFLDNPANIVDVTLQFIIVTEYFEPDYEFDYPDEYLIPVDAISFSAEFGETYYVTITGDQVNGYQADIEES
ncbi:MAG: hypothetical protein IIT86_05720 [Oscillospiraceae bacterium]|nr:hypothetical protein [Oscillospiraceae bacterium]